MEKTLQAAHDPLIYHNLARLVGGVPPEFPTDVAWGLENLDRGLAIQPIAGLQILKAAQLAGWRGDLPGARAADLVEKTADFTDRHCSTCHNDVDKEGGLDLTSLEFTPTDVNNFTTWVKIHDRIAIGEHLGSGPPWARHLNLRHEAEFHRARPLVGNQPRDMRGLSSKA